VILEGSPLLHKVNVCIIVEDERKWFLEALEWLHEEDGYLSSSDIGQQRKSPAESEL
jgi:hypothetical protein